MSKFRHPKKRRTVSLQNKTKTPVIVLDFETVEAVCAPFEIKCELTRHYGHPCIKFVADPGNNQLHEDDGRFDELIKEIEKTVGRGLVLETYVEQTGIEWYTFLNRVPFEVINVDASPFLTATIDYKNS